MGRSEKLLARMETNPRSWRYEEGASVLRWFGFSERRGATSHRQWTHPQAAPVTVVAGSGAVAEYQVRQVVRVIRMTLEEG
jgi:predicted RNA binding protein YcfA (HicA-like mRNA interferase family)